MHLDCNLPQKCTLFLRPLDPCRMHVPMTELSGTEDSLQMPLSSLVGSPLKSLMSEKYSQYPGIDHHGREYEKEYVSMGFPGSSVGKESACNVKDLGSIPGWGRSPGEGHGTPLQCSCLENPMDRGAWWATVHGVTESQTRLSD